LPMLGLMDYSVARSELLVASASEADNHTFWRVPLPTGTPTRIGGISGYEGMLSPDGKRLADTKFDNTLRIAMADGSSDRALPLETGFKASAVTGWLDDATLLFDGGDPEANV